MAPFFRLSNSQRAEYDEHLRAVTMELDFWALENDSYIEDDRAYWCLLAVFERYMDAPRPENHRRLKSMLESLESKGADADWLWEIYDDAVGFVQEKLWPWFVQLWADISAQDVAFMEKLLEKENHTPAAIE